MTESVLDIMSGGTKAPGAFDKYSQPGTTVSGRIDSVEVWDVRKFGSTEVQTWDDGRPQKQLRIVLQADPGTWTPQGEDDSGLRAHYVKAWNPHLQSLRDGLAAVGEQEPKPGGWLSIRYDHDQPSKSGFDTKIYVYQYQAPASDAANLLGGGQPPQQQQPAQQPAEQQGFQQPPQQFNQQQPVAPVAPPQGQTMATPQGQVDPTTGELSNYAAPVPAQQPWEQAQQAPAQAQPAADPWTGQPAPQQAPQQAPQAGPAPGAGMDSNIMKLVQAGLDDATILQTLGAQGVTAQQVAEVRATFG